MKKKWWLITAAIVVACVGLLVAIPSLLPPHPGVTKENFDRIKEGMTRAEVEASLGKPMLISTLTDGKYFVAYMLRIKPAQADAEPESRFITLRYDRNGVVQDLDDKESNSFISVSAGSGAATETQGDAKASKAEEPKVKRKPFVWPENTTPNR